MHIYLRCPDCDSPDRIRLPGPGDWQCPRCDHRLRFDAPVTLDECPVCHRGEFYRKKNFPHWLGLTILTGASLGFFVAHGLYYPRLAWAILIAAAVVDAALYFWVGDVVVCYHCGAHFYGVPARDTHKPFDLGIAERYRQERIRRQQMHSEKKP